MGIVQDETGDFIVNEKDKVVNLTQDGVKKVEQFFHIENLADPENLEIQHNIIHKGKDKTEESVKNIAFF